MDLLERLHVDETRLSGSIPTQLCERLRSEESQLRWWALESTISAAPCGWSAGDLPHTQERYATSELD